MTAFARFLDWWGAELAALAPPRLARALRPTQPVLLVDGPSDAPTLTLAHGARREALGPMAGLSSARLRRLARRAQAGSLDVAVAVPPEGVVARRITLPIAAEHDLDAVLAFEMDRVAPFAADEVWVHAAVAERRPDQALLDVDVAFAPRAPHAGVISALAAVGVTPDRAQAGPLTLMAADRRMTRKRRAGATLAGVAAVALVGLSAAWVALDLRALEAQVAAREAEAAALRRAALVAADSRTGPVGMDAAAHAVAARADVAPVGVVLARLAALLPDDVWLTALRLTPGAVELSGFAGDAASLIPLIDGAPGFAAPRFVSPVNREASGRERFTLTARLTPVPAP